MTIEQARERLIFALDVPDGELAFAMAYKLKGHVGCFKVGLEAYIASGPELVRKITRELDVPVFLDLKLHDIPATVGRAVKALGELGVRYTTVHVGDEGQALSAAVDAAGDKVKILAVTVLTSCRDASAVDQRAEWAADAGCWGVVCSGHEAQQIRARYPSINPVCPGIRRQGERAQDQARVMTPRLAISNGAELLVVGRPIRDADDPVAAADAFASEIQVAIG